MSNIERSRIEAAARAISRSAAARPRKEGTVQRFERYAQAALEADAATTQGAVSDAQLLANTVRFLLPEHPHGLPLPSPDEVKAIVDRYPAGGR